MAARGWTESIDVESEKLEIERSVAASWSTPTSPAGLTKVAGVLIRFSGAYQRDDWRRDGR